MRCPWCGHPTRAPGGVCGYHKDLEQLHKIGAAPDVHDPTHGNGPGAAPYRPVLPPR